VGHFVEWDSLDIRVDGDKLNLMVQSMIGGMPPIETIGVRFSNGLMRVEGTLRKFVRVPFAVDITELRASGTTVRVPLKTVSAAGFPVPLIAARVGAPSAGNAVPPRRAAAAASFNSEDARTRSS